jgi:7,8-dihydropterin-6-yl-methyl-4-(beta-D-ribofuranosyl)aminobenzene 5'-phosphate synthase
MRKNERGLLLRSASSAIVAVAAFAAWTTLAVAADPPQVKITYLYDTTEAVAGTHSSWGFAALVEAHGRRVLFDTGTGAAVLESNAAKLGADLSRLDALVLSHEHFDHTGGIAALGRREGLPVYYPASANPSADFIGALDRAGMKRIPVTEMTTILPRISVSHQMKGPMASEIALLIDTDDGVAVVVGCAHPGPDAMLTQIKQQTGRPVSMLIGGFHLLDANSDAISRTLANFEQQGVRYLGPTHCTGSAAIGAMRKSWGDRFVEGGVGTVVQLAPFTRTTVR